jgi:hypothetical protein
VVRCRGPTAHYCQYQRVPSRCELIDGSSVVGARRVTEPPTKSSCEMGVVTKATGVGDFAERLACRQQRPAMQKVRGVIQTKRIYKFTASRPALSEELLEITQRNPRVCTDNLNAAVAVMNLGPDDRTCRIDGNQRYSWIKNQRSLFVSRTRPGSLRLKTIN